MLEARYTGETPAVRLRSFPQDRLGFESLASPHAVNKRSEVALPSVPLAGAGLYDIGDIW